MRKGFTILEILVVVLIIGILASRAIPSYLKAVELSRSAEAISLLRALYHAQKMYQLEHDKFASSFNNLKISFPGTPLTCKQSDSSPCWGYFNTEALQNDRWSIELEKGKNPSITVGQIKGPYAGTGFFIQLRRQDGIQFPLEEMACVENLKGKYKYKKSAGSYCEEVLSGTFYSTSTVTRKYRVPF